MSATSFGPSAGAGSPRHAVWVRVLHWLFVGVVLTLAYSGIVILMAHPRLYWGWSGNDLTRPLMGSRAVVKESEQKRVVAEASQVVLHDEEKPVAALREGMSDLEVRALLGDPDEILPDGNSAPPWMRLSRRCSHRSLRSLRMVCGVTSKWAASSRWSSASTSRI